ncbi:hypothetical protein D3C86_1935970 [compost metagenome]
MGDGEAGLSHHRRQALDGVAGFAGDVAAAPGQAIGFLGGVSRTLDVVGYFLGRSRHLVNCSSDLFSFDALALKA